MDEPETTVPDLRSCQGSPARFQPQSMARTTVHHIQSRIMHQLMHVSVQVRLLRTVSSSFSSWLHSNETLMLIGWLFHVPSYYLCRSFVDCIAGPTSGTYYLSNKYPHVFDFGLLLRECRHCRPTFVKFPWNLAGHVYAQSHPNVCFRIR